MRMSICFHYVLRLILYADRFFFQERHELLSSLSAPSKIRANIFRAGPSHSNVTLIGLIRIRFDIVCVRGRWSIIQLDQKPTKKIFYL